MSSRQRRRKKHRGTQAGTVRRRGRSPSRESPQLSAEERRRQRLERPPSWRAAANRAVISAVVFFAILVLVIKWPLGAAIGVGAFMLVVYIPMGYAIDAYIYRYRQRKKQQREAKPPT